MTNPSPIIVRTGSDAYTRLESFRTSGEPMNLNQSGDFYTVIGKADRTDGMTAFQLVGPHGLARLDTDAPMKSTNDPILDVAAIVSEHGPISEADVKEKLAALGWELDAAALEAVFDVAKACYVRTTPEGLVTR